MQVLFRRCCTMCDYIYYLNKVCSASVQCSVCQACAAQIDQRLGRNPHKYIGVVFVPGMHLCTCVAHAFC